MAHRLATVGVNRAGLEDFDPFGDFDLLLGAAKLDLKVAGLSIRWRERICRSTEIECWKHGWLLVRMGLFHAGD